MLSVILSILSTSYIPALLTPRLLPFLHSLLPLSIPSSKLLSLLPAAVSQPPPAPGTPAYASHHRILFALVSLCTVLYSIWPENTAASDPNYYAILGVPVGASPEVLKLAFRTFARTHHPDRSGGYSGEAVFREGRVAYEVLKDDGMRFVYERFGPEALSWFAATDNPTPRDYVRRGLLHAFAFYVFAALGIIFWGVLFGSPSKSKNSQTFWRWILYLTVLCTEMLLYVSPTPSFASTYANTLPASVPHHNIFNTVLGEGTVALPWIHTLLPQRVAYQHVRLLHRALVVGGVCIARIGPLLRTLFAPDEEAPPDDAEIEQAVDVVTKLVTSAEGDVRSLMETFLRSADFAVSRPSHQLQSPPKKTPFSSPSKCRLSSPAKAPSTPSNAPSTSHIPAPPLTLNSKTEGDADARMEAALTRLTRELENMVLEQRLRAAPPVRSAWEAAVAGVSDADDDDGGGAEGTLPSPVSPSLPRLPSPRPSPSPPPGLGRRGSSWVRARSVSC